MRVRRTVVIASMIALACSGCGSSLTGVSQEPPLASAPPAQSDLPPAGPGIAPPSVVGSAPVPRSASSVPSNSALVTGFKSKSIILYSGENGGDGRRIATDSLPLPLTVKSGAAASHSGRVEIMTVEGPRWIAVSEVIFARSATPAVR